MTNVRPHITAKDLTMAYGDFLIKQNLPGTGDRLLQHGIRLHHGQYDPARYHTIFSCFDRHWSAYFVHRSPIAAMAPAWFRPIPEMGVGGGFAGKIYSWFFEDFAHGAGGGNHCIDQRCNTDQCHGRRIAGQRFQPDDAVPGWDRHFCPDRNGHKVNSAD